MFFGIGSMLFNLAASTSLIDLGFQCLKFIKISILSISNTTCTIYNHVKMQKFTGSFYSNPVKDESLVGLYNRKGFDLRINKEY